MITPFFEKCYRLKKGFLLFGSQLIAVGDLRGGEALEVAKAVSPPRAPPLWPRPAHVTYLAVRASLHTRPRADALWAKHPQRTVCQRANASDALSPPKEANSPSSVFGNKTPPRHNQACPTEGGFRGERAGFATPSSLPPKVLSAFSMKKNFNQTTKTVLQSSYIKNDNPH